MTHGGGRLWKNSCRLSADFYSPTFPEKQQTKPVEASVGNVNEPRVLGVCSVSISIILASKMILAGRAPGGICFVFSNFVDSEAQSNTSVLTISTTLKYVLKLQLCGKTHGDHHFYQPAKAMQLPLSTGGGSCRPV